MRVFCALLLAFAVLPTVSFMQVGAASAAEPVSLTSLLDEMIDRSAVASLPVPAYACKQASSYDRRKTDPKNAATWHTNNDSGQFMRTEVNEGRHEWVIMEDSGPGAVVRFWVPLAGDKDKQIVRFYLDGTKTPAITARLNDLLCGQGFVRPPLAFVAWNESDLRNQLKPGFKAQRGVAGDMYLPIPYAKGCKITLDSQPFYYHVNYRSYAPGTTVETFSMAGYEAAHAKVAQVGKALGAEMPAADGPSKQVTLLPGAELSLDLPQGSLAVRELRVQIDPKAAADALHSLVVQASFDDQATIWCPIGEFFGTGARLFPVQDWWRKVTADGELTAYWLMPYQHTGRVMLKNVGSQPLAVVLAAATTPWKWDERSMYFHANWRSQHDMKTRPMSDWNYLEVQGQGRYVGDTLTVYATDRGWYGEGDERIYVDGAHFPAHLGTGTEDYYGYAWGMASFFSSPFISMPQRDFMDRGDWRGYTTTSRVRPLDSIPFGTALKHDMEIWHWSDTRVDYAVGTFWYARPGATHNREPQPQEAALPLREGPKEFHIAGAVECETLPVVAHSPKLQIGIQEGAMIEGSWSGDKQLFVQATHQGDFVELQLPVGDGKPRHLTLYGTKSRDYGILRFSVNGRQVGADYDAYRKVSAASGPIDLGVVEPKDGKLLLRVEVVGANAASEGPRYYFGLDCVVLGRP